MTELDLSLETVVSILHTLGNHTIDTEALDATRQKELFETWSRHLLFQIAPPGTPEPSRPEALVGPPHSPRGNGKTEPSNEGSAATPHRHGRDWFAVRGFVEAQQSLQSDQILSDLRNLRTALNVCADSMNALLLEEQKADAVAETELSDLLSTVQSGSPAEIRRAVANTVGTVHHLLEERQARLKTQVRFLSEQVKTLVQEVDRRDRPPELDPLTRLETRQSFDRALSQATALQRMTRERVCLVLVELDDFSQLRHFVGEPTVDKVLKRVARCMSQIFPRRGDTLARFDKNEFVVMLRDATFDDGFKMAQRLLEEIRLLYVEVDGRQLGLTASIGIATLEEGENAHRCLARADGARYKARLQGGDALVAG